MNTSCTKSSTVSFRTNAFECSIQIFTSGSIPAWKLQAFVHICRSIQFKLKHSLCCSVNIMHNVYYTNTLFWNMEQTYYELVQMFSIFKEFIRMKLTRPFTCAELTDITESPHPSLTTLAGEGARAVDTAPSMKTWVHQALIDICQHRSCVMKSQHSTLFLMYTNSKN